MILEPINPSVPLSVQPVSLSRRSTGRGRVKAKPPHAAVASRALTRPLIARASLVVALGVALKESGGDGNRHTAAVAAV